jgi:hypothetical protein
LNIANANIATKNIIIPMTNFDILHVPESSCCQNSHVVAVPQGFVPATVCDNASAHPVPVKTVLVCVTVSLVHLVEVDGVHAL